MNESSGELTRWRPRRWVVAVLLVLIAQLGLVLLLSDYRAVMPRLTRPSMPTHLGCLDPTEGARPNRPDFADPTLFALTTSYGFSRSAWLTVSRLDYQITNELPSPQWLRLPSEDLADEFGDFVRTNFPSDDILSTRLAPALTRRPLPTPVVLASTQVKLEGDLANRHLRTAVSLPRQPEPILTNSVVRVVVNPDGTTLSAVLLSRGVPSKADQDALDFARQARYNPIPPTDTTHAQPEPNGLTIGNVVFQWFEVRWSNPPLSASAR